MILTLRALGVGDLATAVPALRALRTAHPDQQLTLIAPAWLTPLVNLIGGIDHIIDAPDLGPLPWTGPHPDLAVNLHGRGPQSHRMLTTTRPRQLLAFANHEAGHHDGPAWDDAEHEVHRWCRLLGAYGIEADPADLALRRPPPGRLPTGATVLHPGSKVPAKRWPPERFAAVARHLTTAGHHIVITGNHSERPLAHQVAHLAGLPTHTVLAGHTDLHHLATLTAHARLLISGDTGIAHLATAYHTPSVLLFGPASPAHWGPPPDRPRHRVLWIGEGDWSRWDGVGSHPTLAALPIDEVLAAVDEVERTVRVAGTVAA